MRKLNQKEADRLRAILESGQLTKPITIQAGPDVLAQIYQFGPPEPSRSYGDTIRAAHADDHKVLQLSGRRTDLYLGTGGWDYKYDLCDGHIVWGAGGIGPYFMQMEMSECLADEGNIYMIKNLSKLAGKGSILRLNNGTKSKEEKRARRLDLVKRLGSETISENGREWLVVSALKRNEVFEEKLRDEIMTSFVKDFLRFALTVEAIIRAPSESDQS